MLEMRFNMGHFYGNFYESSLVVWRLTGMFERSRILRE